MKTSANPARFVVTTALKQTPEMERRAKEIAAELGCVYVERNDQPVKALLEIRSVSGLLVTHTGKLSYVSDGGDEFFFHPGLAGLRIEQINNGQTDRMIEAMALLPGDSVLDCTLGLGADAIVAAYVAGAAGLVVGLESSLPLAYLVKTGLSSYISKDQMLAESMRRVRATWADHLEYLSGLAAGSFDVVYFDPMFRRPRLQSPAINSLRILADPAPVTDLAIDLAVRIARKRVVLKERRGSSEFERLGFTGILGGRYAPIRYGVIDCHGG